MPSAISIKRRQILAGLMKLLVFIGFAFLSVPFFSSFTSDDITEKQASSTRWVIIYPVVDLVEGEVQALSWSGGLVWVYKRTDYDIELLKNNIISLRDEDSDNSEQPASMQNSFRSASERFFVFIPLENKRNCQVRLSRDKEAMVFTEPCYTAKYDAAGRIFSNSGHKEQENLIVPKHIIDNGVLKVAVWVPKI